MTDDFKKGLIAGMSLTNSIVLSGVNYSLEERVVGTWIDGRRVYQKTIEQSGLSIKGKTYYITIFEDTDIDVVDIAGACFIENAWLPINFYMYSGGYVYCYFEKKEKE
jgi:hypothetical protein